MEKIVDEKTGFTYEPYASGNYAIPMQTFARIVNDFSYHAPINDQVERYFVIRDACKDLALLLCTHCPQSRELSIALTHLEETMMFANASIARNEKPNEADTQ